MLARIRAYELIKQMNIVCDFIQTIHDSIVVDTPAENCYNVCMALKKAVEDVPLLCQQYFGYHFSLPLTCEIQTGPNKLDMKEYVFN